MPSTSTIIYYSESWKEELFGLQWFVYSIIYLYHYGLVNSYFSLWVVIRYYCYLFCWANFSSCGHWEPFPLAPALSILFQAPTICRDSVFLVGFWFSALLIFRHPKKFRACLVLPCLSPRISHFRKESGFPLIGECQWKVQIWALGVPITNGGGVQRGIASLLDPLSW